MGKRMEDTRDKIPDIIINNRIMFIAMCFILKLRAVCYFMFLSHSISIYKCTQLFRMLGY